VRVAPWPCVCFTHAPADCVRVHDGRVQFCLELSQECKKRNCVLAREVIDLEASLQMAKVPLDCCARTRMLVGGVCCLLPAVLCACCLSSCRHVGGPFPCCRACLPACLPAACHRRS
jgi:hypothetical protein